METEIATIGTAGPMKVYNFLIIICPYIEFSYSAYILTPTQDKKEGSSVKFITKHCYQHHIEHYSFT